MDEISKEIKKINFNEAVLYLSLDIKFILPKQSTL